MTWHCVSGVLGQNTVMICALKESSVELTCPVPSWTQVTEIVWYNQRLNHKPYDLRLDPKYEGRVEYHGTTEKDCILRITDLRQSDIAMYYFRYKTDKSGWKFGSYRFTLSVTDLQVKVTPDTVAEGRSVTLTCSTTCTLTDNPNPTYIWYKNGEDLFSDSSPQYQYSVSRGGSDSYSCALRGHDKLSSPKVTVGECGDLPPEFSSLTVNRLDIFSKFRVLIYK
uniref:Ig-like domain-containing protein n=1 Tax=Hucho hucho TaxID=62062 RepID=A0A4W5LPN9_9TELE